MKATARSRHANARAKLRALAVSVVLLLAPAIGLAKQSDRDQPLNYTAVSTDAFQKPISVTTL